MPFAILGTTVVVFPILWVLDGVSIPPVAVTKLVVEEPARYPVWAVFCSRCLCPVVAGVRVARTGDALHGLIFGLFRYVRPVVGFLALAVLLQMALLRCEPLVGMICLLL